MLDNLYREIILDHYRSPKNRGEVEDPDIRTKGVNPLCGDELELTIELDGDLIHGIKFDGHGCSISQASASMLTERVRGLRLSEAGKLVEMVKEMLKGSTEVNLEELGDLEALQGVRNFPVRIKCATLAWNALKVGIEDGAIGHKHAGPDSHETVFTER